MLLNWLGTDWYPTAVVVPVTIAVATVRTARLIVAIVPETPPVVAVPDRNAAELARNRLVPDSGRSPGHDSGRDGTYGPSDSSDRPGNSASGGGTGQECC